MIKVLVSAKPEVIPPGVRYEPATGLPAGITGWFRYSHEGQVLSTGEHNHWDDSDFYALVWDADAGVPREAEYASTRYWTYANTATVDATPEVQAAYDAWRAERARTAQADADRIEAATPRPGKTVEVVKGRKIPVGTTATVFWYGPGRDYGSGAAMRVGLTVDGEAVFTAAVNVRVVPAAQQAA